MHQTNAVSRPRGCLSPRRPFSDHPLTSLLAVPGSRLVPFGDSVEGNLQVD